MDDLDYFLTQLTIVLSSLPKEEAKRRLSELEKRRLVEPRGIEPLASCVRSRRSPN